MWISSSVTCPPYNPSVVALLPHEYMCTWYYRCEQNGHVLMECWPPGTHFSTNMNRCEWESVANCTLTGMSPPSTTTRTTVPFTTTTTIPTVPTKTLTSTIKTVPTITTSKTPATPATSSFIVPTVATSIGLTIPTVPVATTTKTILTTTSTTQPPPECPEVDDPNILVFSPSLINCSSYFLCFNGEKFPRNCAEGFYWDVDNNWCNVRNEVNCGSMKG